MQTVKIGFNTQETKNFNEFIEKTDTTLGSLKKQIQQTNLGHFEYHQEEDSDNSAKDYKFRS